jgi:hypothetical protein
LLLLLQRLVVFVFEGQVLDAEKRAAGQMFDGYVGPACVVAVARSNLEFSVHGAALVSRHS